ncbi:cellulose synthase complex outer membrane protein BcsC [Shimwellia blattae]|uniref:Cellulose synthase subunit n=1 Tax=Shimwellia blattae (strain ATCC 29907 / DSM 4481 / JCM 1650 / NBRC 105725 / CDC 9005-74) TaxID=630626 RepID=I2B432_SHIBC|nr:cellulose synthase complex outer membrane protein BcsC [Shimwellia blattae]AFJ45286.1 cellulose synthase subunit [Shimwellia blattae DSM 4481 = NBRC 105725]GAB80601.1 oxidase BcsC [Shimwellia blattae DSM 4481 = NBRC 105725]VDY62765.1 Cellulose synthase operon protein C precursor [Shimwellia blattae]VEC19592.1 Cellulose synthase operon protein C precursor [Shimwellia blattae]
MHKFSLSLLSLVVGLVILPRAWGAQETAKQHLLDQVRLGESSQRDDLVRQSLHRLTLIAPDDPDVMAARLRYLLRHGDTAGASKLMAQIGKTAPDSQAYRQAQTSVALSSPRGRAQLQQARLLGTTGHTREAIAAYDALFNGHPPDDSLAGEYWLLVAKIPARHQGAVTQLQQLYARAAGNTDLGGALAGMLFADNRNQEGYNVLRQMARSAAGRSTAERLWWERVRDKAPGPASTAALQQYLAVFSDGENASAARQQLAQHHQPVQVPAPGRAPATEPPTERPVAKATPPASKAPTVTRSSRYWSLIDQGDQALKNHDTALARLRYQQARNTDRHDSYALLGLGDVAVAEKNDPVAGEYYRQALQLDAGNSSAVRGLANIYRRQSPEKASAFIGTLTPRQRSSIDDIERSLRDDSLEQQAAVLENQGEWARAAALHQQRLDSNPDSVWITYRLAKDLAAAGQQARGDQLFRALAAKEPRDPERIYAQGLYLAATDRDRTALDEIHRLPRSQWSPNLRALAARLESNQVMAEANRLRDGGQEAQAIALLRQQPPAERFTLALAEWASERGDYPQAEREYQRALARDPASDEARLGLVETFLAAGDKPRARHYLAALHRPDDASLNRVRREARVRNALGDTATAGQLYQAAIAEAKRQPPSMSSAMALRDGARYQAAGGAPLQGLDTLRDAMVAAGISDKRPEDNDSFTQLTRNDARDDWLKRGIRSDAADLYQQQDVRVTLDHDYWGSSGTPGYSDLKAHTTMLQLDAPLSDGTGFLRADVVNMDPGSFGSETKPHWGTCYKAGCSHYGSQRASGVSVAAGWHNATWAGDIGTTPMGFDVVDLVGGLSYRGDLGPLGYTLNAHRRPVSSSLLSFAGQRDPNTGKTWGGVRATGGGISLSYDQGKAHGIWSSLSADSLQGKNVEDNWRVRWMTGYYYKLLNENNRRVTVGVTNMLWHYDKDLSNYTLGQGGYYSPQQYVSFALPVIWRQRTENWSWELGGSVSWSHSQSDTNRRYPLQNLVPLSLPDRNAPEEGGSSSGVGYTARALVERRINSHWSVGAGVDIQQAKDYTPSHGLLFVRYSFGGWMGDMALPPQPLVPYADW